jgi:hypothetical protein
MRCFYAASALPLSVTEQVREERLNASEQRGRREEESETTKPATACS